MTWILGASPFVGGALGITLALVTAPPLGRRGRPKWHQTRRVWGIFARIR